MSDPIQTKIDGQTFYQILGLEEKATEAEIKTSYRKLALKYHPDKVGADGAKEAGEMFIKVKTAYETLSDAEKKTAYDRELELERNPRPKRTFASASNNATYGGSSTTRRYAGSSSGARAYRTSFEDDILEDLLREHARTTRSFNIDINNPPAGTRVRRTADGGIAVEMSWSFGMGGGRSRETRTSGESSDARYSPPPPPMHPSRRDALKGETEVQKKKRLEREARERAELDREREKRELRMAELRRERERERERQREVERLKEEADRYAERARQEFLRKAQGVVGSIGREKSATAAEERLRASRDRGRIPEKKPVRKMQARVEEDDLDFDPPVGVRRGSGPVKDARRSDLPRRPVPQRQDSLRSSVSARRGEAPRREALPPLPPRDASKRDKIAAWAADLDPEEDRRDRYARASSPSSSELVRTRKSKDYGYSTGGRARSMIETSSESSLERRRPSGARSPTRRRHHRSRYYSDSDSYDSEESEDSTRYPRAAPPPREDDRYRSSRHEGRHHHKSSRHSQDGGHSHRHRAKEEPEKKKGGGIGSFIGKVAKSILAAPEESDSEGSIYSSVSSAKRKGERRREEKVGDRRERRRERY
ncbi:DnaJ-domain-containing protein [Ascobolus immersus RN42]|uniref:DnaJ-domain-containing protein n=1 Tax=Ascobolus immersus RN42 TaxID=1160509 RepID=A0A3N4IZQ8_ASCIM|nr:DnaJ-domain-containing protein [Ascobolus immersus RN42]